jgi:hypothetical protein
MCKRAKFRGIPKALTTKDKTETSYLAQLTTEGIVISSKILVRERGRGRRGRGREGEEGEEDILDNRETL